MLLEKAWAKVHGGYYNINAGLTREALRDLTGASCITYFTSDYDNKPDDLWKLLVNAKKKDWILTAGSDDLNYGDDTFISKIGLAGSHAYSILEICELVMYKGKYVKLGTKHLNGHKTEVIKGKEFVKERIIKLRNPWGKGEWNGKWSDNDKVWTKDLKE